MMAKPVRMDRLDEQFKRELGEMLLTKVRDPRVKHVTVMGAKVSKELDVAVIFVSIIGDKTEKAEILKVLDNASGFLRSEMASVIEIRKMPKLVFRLDESFEESMKIDAILTELGYPRNDDE